MREFSVGEIANRCGVAVSALHFYERKGLIYSRRNAGNQRRYGPDTLRRVSIVKAAQSLGVSLAELQDVFAGLPKYAAPSTEQWHALSEQWHARLTLRINALSKLRESLTSCIGCGCLSLKHCPLYNPDDELSSEGPGPVLLHQ